MPSRIPSPSTRETGQAAVFAVIFLLAVAVGVGVLYNTGRLTLDKTRLQNTADSAVYSGGVLLARSYNFSSYANRAMVANQVVIAQMVGLRSWSQYYCLAYNDHCGTQNSANDLPSQIQSLVSGTFYTATLDTYAGISKALYYMNVNHRGISAVAPQGADVYFANKANTINKLLSTASSTFNTGVWAELAAAGMNKGLIADIIQDNDPQATITPYGKILLEADLAHIKGFTQLYTSNNSQHMQQFATVIKNGEDGFTQGRSSYEFPTYPMFNYEDFDCASDWTALSASYNGSTTWSANYQSWSAQDKANVYGFNLVPIPDGCFPVPIVATNPWIYGWPTTLSSANASYNAQGTGTGFGGDKYAGLLPYEDVSNQYATATAMPTLTLDIARAHGTIKTTQQLKVDSGVMALPGGEAGGEVNALASVQVHFVRPRNGNSRLLGNDIEYGALFNPYWEAHLVASPSAATLGAQAAQEVVP
ncbi:MAG: Tad domain-containing protein [Planctomycetia bacterium]|nr:Tad domain-containing protein [Planctomycetia bacterium]